MLPKLESGCSAVGLYCVTITWQQIFKGSLTSRYGSRCFAACDCQTQTSWQVMQRESDCW